MSENTKTDEKLTEIPVSEQKQDVLYKMCLRFKLDIALDSLNDIAKNCGFDEKAIAQNAVETILRQVIPFIPDKETIRKYTEIIQKQYVGGGISCHKVHFIGYDYLYPVKYAEKENDKCEEQSKPQQDAPPLSHPQLQP